MSVPRPSGRRAPLFRVLLVAVVVVTAALPIGPPSGAAAAASPASKARAAYARLTPAQRIGQLFMAAYPAAGSTAAARSKLSDARVGNVILLGHSTAGVTAVAARVGLVRRSTTHRRVLPFVAVDQEGGLVQHLTGPGFSTMPTALRQGRLAAATLRSRWHRWASELRSAGINLDLAPVCDVVPAAVGRANQPIGRYDREYGHTAGAVSSDVAAVVHGISAAGIGSSAKHFPGLGRATGNTDTTVGVTAPTLRTDPELRPFRSAIAAGVPSVMVSTATYPAIDPSTVAVFSHVVVTDMLRGDLGFTGLVVTDSLSTPSLRGFTLGQRATLALRAGVDVLLVTNRAALAPMANAIRRRAGTYPAFAAIVKAAVLHVLTAKARAGLLAPA